MTAITFVGITVRASKHHFTAVFTFNLTIKARGFEYVNKAQSTTASNNDVFNVHMSALVI